VGHTIHPRLAARRAARTTEPAKSSTGPPRQRGVASCSTPPIDATLCSYFASSSDWQHVVGTGERRRRCRDESTSEWWMDGTIAIDAEGDLCAARARWRSVDGRDEDAGWLSCSSAGAGAGLAGSRRQLAAPAHPAPCGGRRQRRPCLCAAAAHDYVAHLQAFSTALGYRQSASWAASDDLGSPAATPTDRFGLSTLSPATLLLSRDSEAPSRPGTAAIFAAAIPADPAHEAAAAWAQIAGRRAWRRQRLHRRRRHDESPRAGHRRGRIERR